MSDKQYDNTNRGVMFRNDRKTKPNQPSHTGSINIEGEEYWLSAWVKEGQKGKFFSMSVTSKDEAADRQRKENFNDFDPDEDAPF